MAKKSVAKETTSKKTTAKKTTAKNIVTKKAAAKKAVAKKAAPKKTTSKKAASKKSATVKPGEVVVTAKKAAPKKASRKTAGAKTTSASVARPSLREFSWVLDQVRAAQKAVRFVTTGKLKGVDPGLKVPSIGPIAFPLDESVFGRLKRLAKQAPFGQGTKTRVDRSVRNTLELDPSQFELSPAWQAAVEKAASKAAGQLGLPAASLEPHVYKLLIYQNGGMFKPHRDSEKVDRMVASMIVVLPNSFRGGDLTVEHQDQSERVYFSEASSGQGAEYAAFYADCLHEVESVYSGIRVCLAYNLVLKSDAPKAQRTPPTDLVQGLTHAMCEWTALHSNEPLVFAFEHEYTQKGLSAELLKGADRQLADVVAEAAKHAECRVSLCQLTRHLGQAAFDGDEDWMGGYRRSRRDRSRPAKPRILGEVYEDEISGGEWRTLDGKPLGWTSIGFELGAIVSAKSTDSWVPYEEQYEGYTGNAGNTLDRWYRKAAVVIWSDRRHYEILGSAGVESLIPEFDRVRAARKTASPDERKTLRRECGRIAAAILNGWPKDYVWAHRDSESRRSPAKTTLSHFAKSLVGFGSRTLVRRLLAEAARSDTSTRLAPAVSAIHRKFGATAFEAELTQLLQPPALNQESKDARIAIPPRDVEWVLHCCNSADAPEARAVAQTWVRLLVERFLQPFPAPMDWESGERLKAGTSEKLLPKLIRAAILVQRDADVKRLVDFALRHRSRLTIDSGQIAALKQLAPWCREQLQALHPEVARWLSTLVEELEAAGAQPPARPTDWRRPPRLKCQCKTCQAANLFLENADTPELQVQAGADVRNHLFDELERHRCDVTTTTCKLKRPFSLVITKRFKTFAEETKTFEKNQQRLADLQAISD